MDLISSAQDRAGFCGGLAIGERYGVHFWSQSETPHFYVHLIRDVDWTDHRTESYIAVDHLDGQSDGQHLRMKALQEARRLIYKMQQELGGGGWHFCVVECVAIDTLEGYGGGELPELATALDRWLDFSSAKPPCETSVSAKLDGGEDLMRLNFFYIEVVPAPH
mgnify:FL=1|jgi:hypothetical protein